MIDNVSLAGSDAVVRQLMALPDQLRTKIEKESMFEANKLLIGRIRSAVHAIRSGALRKSIGGVVRQYQDGMIVVGIVGPSYDFSGNIVVNPKTKRKSFKKSSVGAP